MPVVLTMDPSSGGQGNGYYGDGRGGSHGGNKEQTKPTHDDFDEYMWMANEEQEEKEMIQQIEEEQNLEKCLHDMLDDEDRLQWNPNAAEPRDAGRVGWSSGCPPPHQPAQDPSALWNASVSQEEALANNIQSLSVNEKPKVALNPMAAEFVPGQAFQPPGSG